MEDSPCFDIINFLEEYQKCPCLWDKIHPDFKDRLVRSAAEETVLKITNIADVKTPRKKIRSIRGIYSTEVRKITSSLKTGMVACGVYIPELSWFNAADQFLRATSEMSSESNLVSTF
jgi:hypothetical protein